MARTRRPRKGGSLDRRCSWLRDKPSGRGAATRLSKGWCLRRRATDHTGVELFDRAGPRGPLSVLGGPRERNLVVDDAALEVDPFAEGPPPAEWPWHSRWLLPPGPSGSW